MSASPSANSNGPTPTNGPPKPFMRRRPAADPLRARKKPVPRRLPPPPSNTQTSSNLQQPIHPHPPHNQYGNPNLHPPPNGLQPARSPAQSVPNGYPAQIPVPPPASGPRIVDWSEKNAPKPEEALSIQYYPLFTTKRAIKDGLRYHAARFMSKRDIDPTNQQEFTRPVLLHRRDPRAPPPGKLLKDEDIVEELLDSKEREKQDLLKAEKDRRKAEDLAQIAPTGNNPAAMQNKKNQPFKNEKTTQVFRLDKTAAEKKQSDLRYEEALPWHLEDADNKNTWIGSYEAALSGVNVMLVVDGTRFKMIPIEKWYKFISKPPFETLTADQAEAQLKKKHKEPRWIMEKQEKDKSARQETFHRRNMGIRGAVAGESKTFQQAGKREKEDIDDLDFAGEDLFQDDDEEPGYEPEQNEDNDAAKNKIKKEQLGANIFGEGDENEVDKEFNELKAELELLKKEGKATKKSLKKRERNYMYDSESEHPYSSTSEDDTSDEEKQMEIDKRKDEEAKAKAKLLEAAKTESKLPSGASSKGTNTPSGRPKHTDPLKKVKSLKRPSSPNLSESSGNESSRKKQKKTSSSQPTGSSTPAGSRALSPAPTSQPSQSRKTSIVKLNVNPSRLSEINSLAPNPGAGSDGEATAGEMSDGGRKKKIKLRVGGATPTGSRAGSPAPGKAGVGSRATSPSLPAPALGPITVEEVVAAVPAGGISTGDLVKIFKARIGAEAGKTNSKDFFALVKKYTSFGAGKMIFPKET